MDLKKIQRVRRLIDNGFYADSEILDSIETSLVETSFEQIMSDIDKCVATNKQGCDEQAFGVQPLITDTLTQHPQGEGGRYHCYLADFVAGSFRKLANLLHILKLVYWRKRSLKRSFRA